MEKNYRQFILLLVSFFLFSCAATPEKVVVDIGFARDLAIRAIKSNDEEWRQINSHMEAMESVDLVEFKKMLLSVLKEDPPITTSIAGRWLIYSIIYKIDDRLGTLEYTRTVEGIFNWDRATSLVGTTDLDFITDSGQQIPIFTTVATVDKSSAYLESEGRKVRIYIKEEPLTDGSKRNHVVKIEPLY